MINDNYKEGFVKACINRGLNADETEELCKLANYASALTTKTFLTSLMNLLWMVLNLQTSVL